MRPAIRVLGLMFFFFLHFFLLFYHHQKLAPLSLSSNCCLQTAMKSLFSTSQLTIPAPPVAHSSTYQEDGRQVQAQQNISTPQSNGLSVEPFSLFFPIP